MLPTLGKALYVDENSQILVQDSIRYEHSAQNELLIKTHYSGVNPADLRHSTLGIRSTVIGYDFAGEVINTPTTSKFQKGDVVAGYTPSGMGRQRKYGTHQGYLVAPEDSVFKIPSNLPEPHAAALTVVVMTAADVVHNIFEFPLPTSPKEYHNPVLVWGASSSVGLSAVQLLHASGCKNIFVTASPSRHDLLKDLGATKTFDYASPTILAEINSAIDALGQGAITHAFDAVGTSKSAADLVVQAAGKTAILSSVIQQKGGFRMPVATTKDCWLIQPPGAPSPISIPARPKDHWNAWAALQWAIDNYGTLFVLPEVKVLDTTAEEALSVLKSVADGSRGFGKNVLRHPIR